MESHACARTVEAEVIPTARLPRDTEALFFVTALAAPLGTEDFAEIGGVALKARYQGALALPALVWAAVIGLLAVGAFFAFAFFALATLPFALLFAFAGAGFPVGFVDRTLVKNAVGGVVKMIVNGIGAQRNQLFLRYRAPL